MATKNPKIAKSRRKNAIEKAMKEQVLERGGAMDKATEDMIDTYMDLWDTKEQLADDIKKRGAKITVTTSSGVENLKTNDSVQDLNKIAGQMLKIRAQMHLDDPAPKADDMDDEM